MRREGRVTVQGPVKEQQPDGMSHRGVARGGPMRGGVIPAPHKQSGVGPEPMLNRPWAPPQRLAPCRAPGAVRQAVGGGCQSGWGRLLSVTNAIEAGTCCRGQGRGIGGGGGSSPCVTFRLVVALLRGPGRSPVLPFACCVGSLLSVGRCGWCSCWCRFRVRGAQ